MDIQFDLFENKDLVEIKKTLESVKTSSENVRRGVFARHDKLEKLVTELNQRVEMLEKITSE